MTKRGAAFGALEERHSGFLPAGDRRCMCDSEIHVIDAAEVSFARENATPPGAFPHLSTAFLKSGVPNGSDYSWRVVAGAS
jgi:hypothetical protein